MGMGNSPQMSQHGGMGNSPQMSQHGGMPNSPQMSQHGGMGNSPQMSQHGGMRGNPPGANHQQFPQQTPVSPSYNNYSNIPPSFNSSVNSNYDQRKFGQSPGEPEQRSFISNEPTSPNRESRVSRESTSSITSGMQNVRISDNGRGADSKFHEFEKVRIEYLRRGKLYEDTSFFPNDASIYYSRHPPYDFEWRRAKVSLVFMLVDEIL